MWNMHSCSQGIDHNVVLTMGLWEAANAVYYKCISIHRRGAFGGLGDSPTKS